MPSMSGTLHDDSLGFHTGWPKIAIPGTDSEDSKPRDSRAVFSRIPGVSRDVREGIPRIPEIPSAGQDSQYWSQSFFSVSAFFLAHDFRFMRF